MFVVKGCMILFKYINMFKVVSCMQNNKYNLGTSNNVFAIKK